ncbi:hypothetical protein Fcan01_00473 [Folsomia candida]|uniref:Uncharacterized protein n=1 Tax=Folsomia candida TaxID=158441 RepID=A0A226F7I5_FOLCA|nr:hypothetical protein Fcan01_00473 [Folsomia candida]
MMWISHIATAGLICALTVNAQQCLPYYQDCSFYSRCLETATPCGPSGYAIGLAEKICLRSLAAKSQFSPAGQKWAWNTILCLQETLVPIANGSMILSCDQIKTFGYNSHLECYVKSGFCSLPISDVILIYHIIDIDDEVLRQAVLVAKSCARLYYYNLLNATY